MSKLIEEISSLKKNENELIADSYKVINKILTYSNLKPLKIYYDTKCSDGVELASSFEESFALTSEEFKNIPGSKYHKGVIGIFSRKELKPKELEAPFVILNGVTSPENVGSIVRTISGLGFNSIVVDQKSASPFLRRAVRVSMGNVIFLNVIEIDTVDSFIKECRYPVYATANTLDSIDLRSWQPEMESGFIIGSEGHGIDPSLYHLCKSTVRIPIKDEVDHLNASHSCAIVASRYLFNTSK